MSWPTIWGFIEHDKELREMEGSIWKGLKNWFIQQRHYSPKGWKIGARSG